MKKGVLLFLIIILGSSIVFAFNLDLEQNKMGPNSNFVGTLSFETNEPISKEDYVKFSIDGDIQKITFEEIFQQVVGENVLPEEYAKGQKKSLIDVTFNGVKSKVVAGIDLSDVTEIQSLTFEISGDGNVKLPTIDLNNDGITDWKYVGPLIAGDYIPLDWSYLVGFSPDTEYNIKGSKADVYCNKVTLIPTTQYKIESNVKQIVPGANLVGAISYSSTLGTCGDSETKCCTFSNILDQYSNANCIIPINVSVERDAYLCVFSDNGDASIKYYKIGAEDGDVENSVAYYNGALTSTNYLIRGYWNKFETLLNGVADFVMNSPDSLPLNTLIPIKITSETNGHLTLNNLIADVTKGGDATIVKFTEIEYLPERYEYNDTINIDLSLLNITTPNDQGQYTLEVSLLGDTNTSNFEVVGVPVINIKVNPENPGALQSIEFDASETTSPQGNNLTTYSWDFGDDSTGLGSVVTHSYTTVGIYNVMLKVTDSEGLVSQKIRKIMVGSLAEVLPIDISNTKTEVETLKSAMVNYNFLVLDTYAKLGYDTNINNAITELNLLQESLSSIPAGSNETKYKEIQDKLNLIKSKIPKIFDVDALTFDNTISDYNKIPNSISLGVQEIENFKQSVFASQEGVNVNAEARLINVKYLDNTEKTFVLIIKTVVGGSGSLYEIASSISSVITQGYRVISDGQIYSIQSGNQIIYTVDSSDINVGLNSLTLMLPAVIEPYNVGSSEPALGVCGNDRCEWDETKDDCPKDCKTKRPWNILIFISFLVALLIYYVNFYKGKYNFHELMSKLSKNRQHSTFKTPEDRIAIIKYVKGSKLKGFTNDQIKFALKGKGWKNNQIQEALIEANKPSNK